MNCRCYDCKHSKVCEYRRLFSEVVMRMQNRALVVVDRPTTLSAAIEQVVADRCTEFATTGKQED